MHKIIIYGGGTISHIRNHLALCAPAYGGTAKRLYQIAKEKMPDLDVELKLTKMADNSSKIETNNDLYVSLYDDITDRNTKIIIMNSAVCDFDCQIQEIKSGKFATRLSSSEKHNIELSPAEKILNIVRKDKELGRKDIFLVGFKTTCGIENINGKDQQYLSALNLLKKSSCNLVLGNDLITGRNIIVAPEECIYCDTQNRKQALEELIDIVSHRYNLHYTRSKVIPLKKIIEWTSNNIPNSLFDVVNYCISNKAYKPFNGATAGHFAYKVNDNTFYTSIRKSDFNNINETGLVEIQTIGDNSVFAFGAKPSVGGQSQRIIFSKYKDVDCIVHFHCPKRTTSIVPSVPQKFFECGSHECGENTANGLKSFSLPSGNIYAVYLENHGPNIVFNKQINPKDVISFINENFDLSQKTGGLV